MAYIPKSDSVVAFQSNPSVFQTLSKITNAVSEPVPVQPPASGSFPVINVGSIITTSQGSVATVIIGGSVAAWLNSSNASVFAVPVGNQSVSGTVGSSVIGTVPVTQSGTIIASIVNIVPSSVIVGASIFGLPPVNVTNTNLNVSGSVVAFQGAGWSGSVAATITNTNVNVSGSVASHIRSGSVIAVLGGNTSVITANPLSSVITRPSPLASLIQGRGDLRVVQGASVVVLSAPGASIRNYVKHVQVANFGSASVLVTIADNTTSILGYTIAPAGGGSNYDCFYIGATNSPITASINGTASVLVSMQGFTA